jgi:hypothetical protein
MQNPRIEHLSPAQIDALWPEIKDLIARLEDDGSLLYKPPSPNYIYMTLKAGISHALAAFSGDKLSLILVFEFVPSDEGKVASISVLAGKNIVKFKVLYWNDILTWFKEAGAVGVSACADERLASIYLRKFGFTHTCVHVSMRL